MKILNWLTHLSKEKFIATIGCGALGVMLVIYALFDSFASVPADSVACVTTLGKYTRTIDSGLHMKLPFIENVYEVATKKQYKQEFGFRTVKAGKQAQYSEKDYKYESEMLTADRNIVDIRWSTQYRISDPFAYLFRVRNVMETFRDMNEAVVRRITGDFEEEYILTDGREMVSSLMAEELRKLCKVYEIGIVVDSMIIEKASPPDAVRSSYNDVNTAEQERSATINAAQQEYNEVIPKARGTAKKVLRSAAAYKIARLNQAQGETSHFTAMLAEYRKNPTLTKQRMYFETIEDVLPTLQNKIIIDEGSSEVLPLLNLKSSILK